MKRLISLVLATSLIFAMTAIAATPNRSTVLGEELYRTRTIAPIVKQAAEESVGNRDIANVSSWIPLHDVNGTFYAYFVPMYNGDKGLCGFNVVTDVDGTHSVLTGAESEGAGKYAEFIVNLYAKRAENEILVYSFPDTFLIGEVGKLKIVNRDFTLESAKVSKDAKDIVKVIKNINLSKTMAATRSTNLMSASLTNWAYGDFVPVLRPQQVAGGGTTIITCYGGKQNWLENKGISSSIASRACGLTAAANMFHYLSENISGKSALYTKSGITWEDFANFQVELYNNGFVPTIAGIPNASYMDGKIQNWSDSKNVNLTSVLFDGYWVTDEVQEFICEGLSLNRPVLMCTWNSDIEDLYNHWVTVTKVYDTNGPMFICSNREDIRYYDLDVWASMGSQYRCLMYYL
ncbi:MAG: hypothetical protein IJO47_03115 [Clostridia bacterium]|nr:hypothetical protein [Clostridia bacterium]